MPSKNPKRNAILLAAIIILGLILRWYFFAGVGTSDDLLNTKYSYDISKNVFPTTENQANSRIGLLIPVSVIYKIFGINDYTSTALILLTSLGGILLIYFFGKSFFNAKIGLLAAFLLAIFPLDVIYSTRFLSDLPSAFFSSLAIYIFLKCEKMQNNNYKKYALYLFCGILMGISFSIREMAVLAILFFLVYTLYNRKFKPHYLLVAAGFLLIIFAEMVFFYLHTGNPFYRFNSLNNYYIDAVLYHNFYGRLSFPKFFLAWPYVIFGSIQLGYFYAFISLAIVYWAFNRKTETDYMIIWFLSVLLYLNFGTSSASRYIPFLAVARYLSYITIPGILLLSAFLMEKKGIIKKYFMPFCLIFLLFTSIGAVYLDNSRYTPTNLREIYSFMKTTTGNKAVYTDSRSKLVLEYLSGYNENLNVASFESSPQSMKNVRDAYIIINNEAIKNREIAGDNITFINDIRKMSDSWTQVKEIGTKDNNALIYYAR